MLIFVGYQRSWGTYKRMVKYETSSGDLVVPWEESGTRDWCWDAYIHGCLFIYLQSLLSEWKWVPIFMGCLLSRFYGSTSCTCVFNLDFHSVLPTWVHGFQVDRCLLALQSEVENFVLRMAAEFPDRNEQLIFLINNYDMMLTVLLVGRLLPQPLTPSPPHPLTFSPSHSLTPSLLTPSHPPPSHPLIPFHPLTPYCNSLTPSHPHPLPSHPHPLPSPLTHSHPLIPFHPLTPYCNSLTPSGLSPPQPLTPSSLISHGPHTLTPSDPHTLTYSSLHPHNPTPSPLDLSLPPPLTPSPGADL